jgi:hypothetical protein
MQLSLDKSIRVEPFILSPDRSFPDITKIDTVAIKNRSTAIVVSSEFADLICLLKARLNSKYNVFVEIDPHGSTFGLNKMLQKVNYNAVDGCEIGLSKNKNYTELMNEMKTVVNFLKQFGKTLAIRWVIDAAHGTGYIDNCMRAIKESKEIKFDMIRVLTPPSMAFDKRLEIANLIREGIGMAQSKIKIDAEPENVSVINNVMFSIHASKL